MNNVPFPLIAPVNEEQQLYQGYIPINDVEYYIQIQLGTQCNIQGEKKLLELYNEHPDKNTIKSKLGQATDIMSFLVEFKEMLENTSSAVTPFHYSHDRYAYIYNELNKIGFDKVDEISNDMSEITFKQIDSKRREHLLNVKIPSNYPIGLPQVKCELPSPLSVTLTSSTLPQLLLQHEQLVNKYQDLFDCLDNLDKHMRIVEPEQPKRSDCWRRIALGYHCTLELEFNPEMPVHLKPKASFFGSLSRVNDLKSKWSKYKWNKSLEIHENLFNVFQLTEESSDTKEDYLNTGDIECGICYSYKLDDASIPGVICSNTLCSRGFHHSCLYEWLRGNPTTTQSFNVLFGKCPYCNQKITINAKLT